MTETTNLGLPFIDGSQAQKHVTHNEALRILDDAIQIAVRDTTLVLPPSSPIDGERHIVANGAGGAWVGHGKAVATWETNAWRFLMPKAGWCVWSIADDALLVFDGSNWIPVTVAGGAAFSSDNLPHLGINTDAVETNLLTVRSDDVLFHAIDADDDGTGDIRLQLSKETAENTASVVFANAFSGRAEFGLTGDDDFHLKVSADGTAWRDALRFERTTGRVSFPSGGTRELLTANRIYYVSTTGSDSNNGLSSSEPFLTIAKALTVALNTLDFVGFTVTIQLADGSYTGSSVTIGAGVGVISPSSLVIRGNSTTPANVKVTGTATTFAAQSANAICTVLDMEISSSSGSCLAAAAGGQIYFGNVRFGTAPGGQITVTEGGVVQAVGDYAIIAGSSYHAQVAGGLFRNQGRAVTLSGAPAFTNAFIGCSRCGSAIAFGSTYAGSATGKPYDVNTNGVLLTFGGTLPGNASATTASGGQVG